VVSPSRLGPERALPFRARPKVFSLVRTKGPGQREPSGPRWLGGVGDEGRRRLREHVREHEDDR
jgi:hypothetical protein